LELEFGSVCSGIEAASVAWDPLGWKAAWFAEIEAFPAALLAHHYPHVPNLGDMTTIARRVLSGEVKAPGLLCGGTPCQAFSVAGLRKSLDDDRGNLTLKFVELADAIDHVRVRAGLDPADIVWENVPGVLSTKDNAFGCFLAGLAGEDEPLQPPGEKWSNAGCVYGPKRAIAWRTLDAQYFGLAQRRRRVFVVASAGNRFDPATVLFEWDGVRRDTPPSRQAGKDAAGTLASRTDGGGFPGTGEACSGYVQPASGHYLRGMRGEVPSDGRDPCARPGGMPEVRGGEQPQSSRPVVAFGGNRTSGSIDISPALLAQPGSGYKGDFESETFLVQETAHTLRGEGFDASEDGTGRGTPLVPVAFDTTQVTSATNRSNPKPGDPCHPLAAGAHPPAIAFDCKASGMAGFGVGEIASTMRAMGHAGSHSNGGGQLAVAVALRGREGGATAELGDEVQNCLRASSGGGDKPHVLTAMQVRRLTPTECERLQGFPDGWTQIPWRNKPASECPDGPRYKALGNSWATHVVNWLGRRLAKAKGLKVPA